MKKIARSVGFVAVLAFAALIGLGAATPSIASCGSAFCAINTNWDTQGAWSQTGWRLDLRYEYIHQDQLQEGKQKVAIGQVPRDHDEVDTVNRNWLASLDYTFNADWAINLSLPLVKRQHLHIETATQEEEAWDFSKLGDVRVVARYRIGTYESAGSELGTLAVNFGLKLATGRFDMQNVDGEQAERTLQPGSGTTDALLGAYYSKVLPLKDLSWFAQGLLQVPLNSRDGFKPGQRISLDAGVRYDVTERVGLMLQINGLYKSRDSGDNAEPEDSGGQWLHLSPGVSFEVAKDVRIYGFLQAPLYQYVNGVQLTARGAGVIGLTTRF